MATPLSDVKWIHGAAVCKANADPLLQVHRFDADTFIMRENKCYSAEGNFMYLLLGMDKALLLDTGDLQDADSLLPRTGLPLAQAVRGILAERQPPLELIVAHTHSHGDHVFWDSEFPPDAVVGHDRKSHGTIRPVRLAGRPGRVQPGRAAQVDAHGLPAKLTGAALAGGGPLR